MSNNDEMTKSNLKYLQNVENARKLILEEKTKYLWGGQQFGMQKKWGHRSKNVGNHWTTCGVYTFNYRNEVENRH